MDPLLTRRRLFLSQPGSTLSFAALASLLAGDLRTRIPRPKRAAACPVCLTSSREPSAA